MNGIEKITGRIAENADQEAKTLLQRAEKEAAEIRAGYEATAESEYAETVRKGKADAEDRIVRLQGVAQLEGRKLQLAAKQEMLDKAFDAALEQLLNLPENDYVALLAKLAVEGSSTGAEALIFSVKDRPRYGKRVVIAANELLRSQGKPANLTLSEESREFQGGLYIQNGKIENNCTFATIIRMLREQMSGEVASILFD